VSLAQIDSRTRVIMTKFNELLQIVVEQIIAHGAERLVEEGEEMILELESDSIVITRKKNRITVRLLSSMRDEFSFEI